MTKQKSVITIAHTGKSYRIDARGAFGGGYKHQVDEREIKSALAMAYMQYGKNPEGCEIVGDTEGLDDYIAQLTSGKKTTGILLKVSDSEKLSIEVAAKASGADSVTDYLLSLHRQKK